MAFGDLTNKLEAAAAALLAANPVSGLTGLKGQSEDAKTRPSVIFSADNGEEFPQGSGNFNLQLTCRVESPPDDVSLATHRGFFAAIVDLLTDAAVATNLSEQVADFFVFGVKNPRFETNVQDRANHSVLALDVYCCATDIG